MSILLNKALAKISWPVYYDDNGQFIFDQKGKMIGEIRGWGWIQKLGENELEAAKIQAELGEKITELINTLSKRVEIRDGEQVYSLTLEELKEEVRKAVTMFALGKEDESGIEQFSLAYHEVANKYLPIVLEKYNQTKKEEDEQRSSN